MRRTIIGVISAVILIITTCAAIASDGDVTRFGNSTTTTATIGGTNGTLNYTGVGYGKSLNVSGDVCIIGGNCLSTVSAGGTGTGGGWLNTSAVIYLANTSGKVGIGTNAPTDTLDVHGNVDFNLSVNGLFEVYNTTNALFNVNGTSGRVGIGTNNPGFLLDVRGNANLTGLLTALELSAPINFSFIRNTPTNCTGDNFFQIGEGGGLRFCSTLNNSAINLNALNGTLNQTKGGTGRTSYTTGDLLTGNSSGGIDIVTASTSGLVLTSNGAGTKPTWQSSSGGAFTFVRNITFANSNVSQYVLAQGDVAVTCNTYQVCINIYQNGTASTGTVGLRVNDISSGTYKNNRVQYSTLANPSTDTSFGFHAVAAGTQDFFGCINIPRVLNPQGDILAAGSVASSDQEMWWGGRVAASGSLTNISVGLYNLTGVVNGNLSGTAEVYCKRNQ